MERYSCTSHTGGTTGAIWTSDEMEVRGGCRSFHAILSRAFLTPTLVHDELLRRAASHRFPIPGRLEDPAADLGDDLFVGFVGAVDAGPGVFLVEGVSFLEQIGDGFAGAHDDAAGVEVGEAAFEEVGGEVEVDDDAVGG